MRSLIRNAWLVTCVLVVVLASASCAASHVKVERQGYFSDPIDFIGVNFKSGRPIAGESLSSALSDSRGPKSLDTDLSILKRMPPDIQPGVVGFADSHECSDCSELSLRRAQAVHGWLLGNGISKSRLSTPHGFGNARPGGDNETESS